MITIELPFPSSKLSGHATYKGGYAKAAETKKHRAWAHQAAYNALKCLPMQSIPDGDIYTYVTLCPPNNRGDRLNYPNRMKPYFDGIADGLGVNDKRFAIPFYACLKPEKPGYVRVQIISAEAAQSFIQSFEGSLDE